MYYRWIRYFIWFVWGVFQEDCFKLALLLSTKLSAMGFPPACVAPASTWLWHPLWLLWLGACLCLCHKPCGSTKHPASRGRFAHPPLPSNPHWPIVRGKRPKGKKGNRPDEHSEPLAYSGFSIGLVMYILKKRGNLVGCFRCWTYRQQSLKFRF